MSVRRDTPTRELQRQLAALAQVARNVSLSEDIAAFSRSDLNDTPTDIFFERLMAEAGVNFQGIVFEELAGHWLQRFFPGADLEELAGLPTWALRLLVRHMLQHVALMEKTVQNASPQDVTYRSP